ncbi:MAG: iron chelate uptake ABC transporter family permease subunit [Microbacterium enclense]
MSVVADEATAPAPPRRRAVFVATALFAGAAALAVLSLTLGKYPIAPDRLLSVAVGAGSDFEHLVLVEWRLPTAIAAIVFGAALGLAGAVVQRLTRNPLGSPDLVGIDVGAFTGVAIAMILLGAKGFWEVAAAASLGGLLTAALVTALAYRGGLSTFRLIVVGIAFAAALGSINAFLITRADVGDAMSVGLWGAGSLARVSWESLGPSTAILALVAVAALLTTRSLRSLDLGDDIATAHGVDVVRLRLTLIALAVVATAVVTANTGPLAFVALAAPHVARRLAPGTGLVPAIGAGAFLLASAQLTALGLSQAGIAAPVGLVTLSLGGAYLLTLLIGGRRR